MTHPTLWLTPKYMAAPHLRRYIHWFYIHSDPNHQPQNRSHCRTSSEFLVAAFPKEGLLFGTAYQTLPIYH